MEQRFQSYGLELNQEKTRIVYCKDDDRRGNHENTSFDFLGLRIDCNEAEEGLKTTPCSECALNALAIDEPLEYARLYFEGNMQTWVDAEDSVEIW